MCIHSKKILIFWVAMIFCIFAVSCSKHKNKPGYYTSSQKSYVSSNGNTSLSSMKNNNGIIKINFPVKLNPASIDFVWDGNDILSRVRTLPNQGSPESIYYIFSAPEFKASELFRIKDDKKTDTYGSCGFDAFTPYKDGFACVENDMMFKVTKAGRQGNIYNLNELFSKTGITYDDSEFKNDMKSDGSEMLICTYKGLYQVDVASGKKRLIQKGIYDPPAAFSNDGTDCNDGTNYNFIGPIEAKYSPDNSMYAYFADDLYNSGKSKLYFNDAAGKTIFSVKDSPMAKWVDSKTAYTYSCKNAETDYSKKSAYKDTLNIINPINKTSKEFDVPEAGDSAFAMINSGTAVFHKYICSENPEYEACVKMNLKSHQIANSGKIFPCNYGFKDTLLISQNKNLALIDANNDYYIIKID